MLTMRTFGKLTLTLGAVALLAAPAAAQQRGFGFGMGGGGAVLLAPNVQKDLKLSDEQVEKVRPTLTGYMESHRDDYTGLRDLEPQERQQRMAQLQKQMSDYLAKELKLSDEQVKRMGQIQLQGRGVQAYNDPEVQGRLKLTEAQKTKMQDIGRQGGEQMREIFQNAGDDRQAAMTKMRQLSRELASKAQAELTDEQKATWKEMTGAPIEPEFPRPNQ